MGRIPHVLHKKLPEAIREWCYGGEGGRQNSAPVTGTLHNTSSDDHCPPIYAHWAS